MAETVGNHKENYLKGCQASGFVKILAHLCIEKPNNVIEVTHINHPNIETLTNCFVRWGASDSHTARSGSAMRSFL